ncbi:MAG TPA: gamma-aminobutyraldehyde dehydrogenase [Candidatus Nanopelagicales bacterium]|nr:gamma-aminobutyraldehyde dehydrogenase [Candidatus Nanopelagicales bacterium]
MAAVTNQVAGTDVAGSAVIDGVACDGTSGQTHEVLDPATGTVVATLPLAGPADVDRAVAAAVAAFGGWSRATPAERSGAMHRLAALMSERAEAYAQVETAQTGKPIKLTREFDVPGSIDNVSFFAGAARNLEGKASAEYEGAHTSSVRREALGVVGSIAPWNYPLQMAMWKILPAIAAGNTIVLKPAELTPLTALMFAADALEAGIPAGVVNVVTGRGTVAGEALLAHRDVRMVSFTGSTPVGSRVMEVASQTVKRVHLELGGKAPFVVFDDADLAAAVQGAVAGALINSGQDCTAATRAYVQRPLYEAFVAGVADVMGTVRLGDPRDPATDQGPLVSRLQQERVAGFVDRARGYGARIVRGGQAPSGDLAKGAYYEPTLVTDVAQDSEIAAQELFGPVLVVLPFDSDDDGLALANDTPFGLAASAWTRDLYRGMRATREIQAGCVWINDHIPIVSEMPHGGYKQSGFGKDMSQYSLDEYTQVKHVSIDITADAEKDWHRTVFGTR